MIISRTPFRISFFGGGTDYPDWVKENGGAVLGATIDKYCYITLRVLPPFFSHKYRIVYSKVETVKEINEIQHPVVRAVLDSGDFKKGLEIHHDGDLPARSGLGSSSSFTVGFINALSAIKGDMIPKAELAKQAIHVEQTLLGEPVGYQDQILAAHGGFNKVTFNRNGSFDVTPMVIESDKVSQIEDHMMLFFTGISRYSADVAESQVQNLKKREKELLKMRGMVDEAIRMLSSNNGFLKDFGNMLHETWQYKKQLSDKVTTSLIDETYQAARDAGAMGGKILGAGGGGFILFFVKPENQQAVKKALSKLIHVPFNFENTGSRIVLYQPNGL